LHGAEARIAGVPSLWCPQVSPLRPSPLFVATFALQESRVNKGYRQVPSQGGSSIFSVIPGSPLNTEARSISCVPELKAGLSGCGAEVQLRNETTHGREGTQTAFLACYPYIGQLLALRRADPTNCGMKKPCGRPRAPVACPGPVRGANIIHLRSTPVPTKNAFGGRAISAARRS